MEASSPGAARDVVIIGSGPAGYTAAVYAARAQLRPLVFEGVEYGGALMTTTEVENYPGFPEGLAGPELMEQMRQQALRFGAELHSVDVDAVELRGRIKTVHAGGVNYSAHAVILAMGASSRDLGVPGEHELRGRGVSTCATCDGFFFRDQDVAVVGGGDSAMEEATFLTRFARSVTIVHRKDSFRASRVMLERARSNHRIKWRLNAEITQVVGESRVTSARLRDTHDGAESELGVTGVFTAVGHIPRSQLVQDQIQLDEDGYVVTIRGTQTNLDGVFAAGDLVDRTYRQAITAAGSGCAAALDAERWLAATVGEPAADPVAAGARMS
jgi:thioredoxin reductase (NADPH)